VSQITRFLISHGGLFLFLIVFADQSGLPLPAVPWLLASGALAADKQLNLVAVICWAAIGSLAADALWFYIGRRGKSRIFRAFPRLQAVRPGAHKRITTRLILRGARTLTVAKFLPFGTVVPLRAGALSRPAPLFLLVDAFCSFFYAGVYVLLGLVFHNQLERVVAIIRNMGAIALMLLIIAVAAYFSYEIVKRRRISQGSAHTKPETWSELNDTIDSNKILREAHTAHSMQCSPPRRNGGCTRFSRLRPPPVAQVCASLLVLSPEKRVLKYTSRL